MNKKYSKEDLCRQCGKCCYMKAQIGSINVFTDKHCEFLNEQTNLCTVYKDRFKIKPGCLTIEQAIDIRALPNDCPYVKDKKDYKGPTETDKNW